MLTYLYVSICDYMNRIRVAIIGVGNLGKRHAQSAEKNRKVSQILVTSNTLSSSKIISKFRFKKVIHQFFPIDQNYITKNFINYWKPY